MTGPAFTTNDLDSKKLWDSSKQLSACKSETRTEGGSKTTRTEVPIVTCACRWRRFQKEAEDWVAPGGQLIADPQTRNRRINAAYAQLWLADQRFQWAGLAAFASKQVGCGLLHAANLEKRIEAEHQALQKARQSQGETLFEGLGFKISRTEPKSQAAWEQAHKENPVPLLDIRKDGERSLTQQQLHYVYDMLALGNTALFLDVYPLHRFFMVHGFKEMQNCLQSRRSIDKEVIWPIAKQVPFGQSFPEITKTFTAIEEGDLPASVYAMATHEQINILQPSMYDDLKMAALIRGTHAGDVFSWVTGLLSGVPEGIQLTLASQCRVDDSRSIALGRNPLADLTNKDQRMEFVKRAADRFNQMLSTSSTRNQLEQSIRNIANGGGVQ